jgi:hypothetical protein
VVLPHWKAGSATSLTPLTQSTLFSSLAFNAFNYQLLGAAGFRAVMHLTRRCLGWQLTYSDLGDAISALNRLWPQVVAHHDALDRSAMEGVSS